MKQILLIFLVAVLLPSCKKENLGPIVPNDPYVGTGSAELNGENWAAEVTAIAPLGNDSLTIGLIKKDANGIVRAGLSFHNIPIVVQKNKLEIYNLWSTDIISAKYITILGDGDISGERYIVNALLDSNFIEIQKIDTQSLDIEGRFEVLLTIDPDYGKTFPSSPDTLHFKNGRFKVRVKP